MMAQTPTSPPPNVDASATAAVAMNASAIPLSPGGTPVATAVATAGANASAITTSPSFTPVAAIGLKVRGTNSNVMFAPL